MVEFQPVSHVGNRLMICSVGSFAAEGWPNQTPRFAP